MTCAHCREWQEKGEKRQELTQELCPQEGSTLRFEHYVLRNERNIRVKFVVNLGSDVFWKNVVVTWCKRWISRWILAFVKILTYLLTYSIAQSPSWEANWFAASQEIPRISRNPKVHYRTHKPPPAVPILGQPNPVHILTSHLLKIHPNIIHPSTPRSPQWSPSLRFTHQGPIHPPLLPHTGHMPSPSHSSRFYHPHNIGWGVQII